MISGQGTMGLEIIDQVGNLDAVVIPVGGGGLLAGVALAVKTIFPNVQIIVRFDRTVTVASRCRPFERNMMKITLC